VCEFSLVVATRNRWDALQDTFRRLTSWYPADGEVLVYDDASSPGARGDLADDIRHARWFSGTVRIGLSRCRNFLFRRAHGKYIICLDDDADLLTTDACEILRCHFDAHPRCGIITFRVWWSEDPPSPGLMLTSRERTYECGDFLGGASAMRAACFAESGGYAEWMNLYGEETYVAIGAALRGWEVHYLPSILVHHRTRPLEQRGNRAQVKSWLRQQLCNQLGIVAARLPVRVIPLRTMQLLAHYGWNYGIKQGLPRACLSAVVAFVRNLPAILHNRTRMSPDQYRRWQALPPPVYYWSPDGE
jgi:GT2 family glycosyltransferase